MSKVVRFVVLPLAVVAVIGVGLAIYIAATFDPNQYKPYVIQAVKDKTQRTLKLEGDIKLSFFPGIGATLGKVSLSDRANDREFAAMDEFRTSLKLLPLLSQRAVVDSVEIKNLRANLVRYKDGTTNIDDLTGRDQSVSETEVASPVSIDIDHVTIANAAIILTDEAAGATYNLGKVNLKTGRMASGVPAKIDLSLVLQSEKPKLDLETALKTTFTYDLGQQHFVLDELNLSARGLAGGISNLVLNAKGNVDGAFAGKTLAIANLVVAATGKQQDGGDLNVKLDVPALSATSDKVKGENIAFDVRSSSGKNRFIAKLDVPAIDGTAQAFSADAFTASVEMQQTGATIKANMAGPLTGSIAAQRIEFGKLVATVNVNNPRLQKNPLAATVNGTGQVDFSKQNANLTFVTKLDDSNIKGKAGLARFSPPFYTFDVDIDQLDADRYLLKPDPKKPQEQPFDLAALKELNASGSIRIGTLTVANVKSSNVRLDFKAANEKAVMNPVAAGLYQGSPSLSMGEGRDGGEKVGHRVDRYSYPLIPSFPREGGRGHSVEMFGYLFP